MGRDGIKPGHELLLSRARLRCDRHEQLLGCADGQHDGQHWTDHPRNIRFLDYQQSERGGDQGDDQPGHLDLRVAV